jgi:hypothetical protein
MSHVHPHVNPLDGAVAPVDHEPSVAGRLHALPYEPPRIGSFATGLTTVEPRPWSGMQMVDARQSGVASGALPDESPRTGSFATGLTTDEPRPWSGEQMVGEGRARRR